MAASAPTNLFRKKPNPTWKQGGYEQMETYQGSPMDLATSLPSLNKEARGITSLLDKDSERVVENGLIQLLHLNRKGSSYLANKFIKYINSS